MMRSPPQLVKSTTLYSDPLWLLDGEDDEHRDGGDVEEGEGRWALNGRVASQNATKENASEETASE
jgi:hypothetical protein